MDNTERELDRLYGLPLADFTQSRSELAKCLREAGDGEAAAWVAALRKPTISAWTINQLAREEEGGTRKLLHAAGQVRKTQEETLRGGSPDRVREASEAEREAITALVDASQAILAEHKHSTSDAIRRRIATTLRAAATDPEARELLKAGRLTQDLDPSGFGPLFGLDLPPSKGARKPGARSTTKKERQRVRQAERRKVEEEASERKKRGERERLGAEVRDLRRRLETAEREALAARRQATRKQAAADDLVRRIEGLEKRLGSS